MTNEELMNYAKGRIKTYTFHKLNIFDATTKEKFEECAAELLSDKILFLYSVIVFSYISTDAWLPFTLSCVITIFLSILCLSSCT